MIISNFVSPLHPQEGKQQLKHWAYSCRKYGVKFLKNKNKLIAKKNKEIQNVSHFEGFILSNLELKTKHVLSFCSTVETDD